MGDFVPEVVRQDETHLEFSGNTIFRWCKALGINKYKRDIRPKLMPRHYISRLEWVLDDLVKDGSGAPKLLHLQDV